jgi:drug/metabolite transporter (DMT)-like permease
MSTSRLSPLAFATLLLIAFMMGANHVAARLAFNSGLDVATAVTSRSLVTAAVVIALVLSAKVPRVINAAQARGMLAVGVLVGLQSQCLYSAVARLPVALALLAFNTYPLWTALWDRLFYKQVPERSTLIAMPIILLGLALALDVSGAASGLDASAHWTQIGQGVLFALAGAATFGLALVFVQHETAGVDGRVRTASTMLLAGAIALAVMAAQGGPHWPQSEIGWWGLAALTFLYGTAFTIMFTVLPRLGVAGNSAIMNVEPVFALVLAWAVLDQRIALVQVGGALLVVGAVMWLGLRKR